MTQTMIGVTILIASPGDALPERGAVRDRLTDWNLERGRREKVALLPWLWERHATAEVGDRPQALINGQAVDQADVVVAFFDSRLGTSTGVDVSGTAEEINRAVQLGKPVHVYFSNEDLPRDVDPKQLAALKRFKEQLGKNALLGEYNDPVDLAGQVVRAIERDIETNGWGGISQGSGRPPGARLAWQHFHEEQIRGTDKQGRTQYRTTANDLVVNNDGDRDAEDLTFEVEALDGAQIHFEGPSEPVTIHVGSTMSWHLIPIRSLGSGLGRNARITAQWAEAGEPKMGTWTIRLE